MRRSEWIGFLSVLLLVVPFVMAQIPENSFSKESQIQMPVVDNYTIRNVSWSDAINCDAAEVNPFMDSNVRNNWLAFYVDYTGSGSKTLFAKIYSKLSSASTYTLYLTSDNLVVQSGVPSTSPVKAIIGWPNTELPHGNYDFRIEIYQSGGSTILVYRDRTMDPLLANRPFELSSEDPITVPSSATGVYKHYIIGFVNFQNPTDVDGDGYTRHQYLKVDVNVLAENCSRSVYAKVYYNATSPYASYTTLYYTSGNFTVEGSKNSGDAFLLDIGLPNPELTHNNYFFKLEIWEPGGSAREASWSASDNPFLMGNFETSVEDGGGVYSLTHTKWHFEGQDADGDGYKRFELLHIDVDYSLLVTKSVLVKLYYKLSSSGTYQLYTTTASQNVLGGTENENFDVWIGRFGFAELPRGTYDFKIEAYEAGSSSVVTSMGPDDNSALKEQQFETTAEDAATGVSAESEIPGAFGMLQNYPNPFNPETLIRYEIPKEMDIQLDVFNANGQRIRTLVQDRKNAGYYTVVWDGKNESGDSQNSGVYVCVLKGENLLKKIKAVLIR